MDGSRLPRTVRRELLLARAAVERVEAARALRDFRRARGPLGMVSDAFSARGSGAGGFAGNVASLLVLLRQHPYLGSLASIAFGAFQGSKIGRWTRRLGLLAALAAGGVWLAARVAGPRDGEQPREGERDPGGPR